MNEGSGLSAAKRALLERRLQGIARQPAVAPTIARRPDPASAPLSFIQRQMWLIEQLAPGNPAYHLPYGFRLRGALDAALIGGVWWAYRTARPARRVAPSVQAASP